MSGPDAGSARNRALRGALGHALVVAACGFVAWTAWRLVERWEPATVEIDWSLFAGATAVLCAANLTLAYGWVTLIRRMTGAPVLAWPGMRLFMLSQLARYIPGKIGLVAVRMTGAGHIGVSSGAAGSSILVEAVSWLATGVTSSLVLLVVGDTLSGGAPAVGLEWLWAALLPCVAGVAVLVFVDRRRCPPRVLDRLGLNGAGPLVPRRLLFIHLAMWLLCWGHGVALIFALGGSGASALKLAPLFLAAQVGGFLAVPMPAGAGVREAITVLALEPTLGPATALAAALLSRGAWLIADLVVGAGLAWKRR
jgi:hypothetical protein